MNRSIVRTAFPLIAAMFVMNSIAADEVKNVTVIRGQSSADGSSEVTAELLEECIVSLPRPADLEPQITAESGYLKEINGDPAKNEFVKTYAASLEINYMLHQKELIIVTTRSVQGQAPVMKEVDKNIRQTKRFESNPANGDLYAGRSNRQYYFSTSEAAANDVKKRAETWLKQQSAVVCVKR
jgi:hypothetical protein